MTIEITIEVNMTASDRKKNPCVGSTKQKRIEAKVVGVEQTDEKSHFDELEHRGSPEEVIVAPSEREKVDDKYDPKFGVVANSLGDLPCTGNAENGSGVVLGTVASAVDVAPVDNCLVREAELITRTTPSEFSEGRGETDSVGINSTEVDIDSTNECCNREDGDLAPTSTLETNNLHIKADDVIVDTGTETTETVHSTTKEDTLTNNAVETCDSLSNETLQTNQDSDKRNTEGGVEDNPFCEDDSRNNSICDIENIEQLNLDENTAAVQDNDYERRDDDVGTIEIEKDTFQDAEDTLDATDSTISGSQEDMVVAKTPSNSERVKLFINDIERRGSTTSTGSADSSSSLADILERPRSSSIAKVVTDLERRGSSGNIVKTPDVIRRGSTNSVGSVPTIARRGCSNSGNITSCTNTHKSVDSGLNTAAYQNNGTQQQLEWNTPRSDTTPSSQRASHLSPSSSKEERKSGDLTSISTVSVSDSDSDDTHAFSVSPVPYGCSPIHVIDTGAMLAPVPDAVEEIPLVESNADSNSENGDSGIESNVRALCACNKDTYRLVPCVCSSAESLAEKKKTRSNNGHEEAERNPHKLSGSSFSHCPKIVGTAQGRREDAGIYVGFANLPNQVHRKSVKRGFEFTLMVIGESGLGKSTLVDSLFLTTLYSERQVPNAIERIKRTVSLTTSTVEIEEKGVKLKLTVVDTPGIGDAVDTTKSWMPIVNYINDQYEAYLKDESGLNRRNISDNRVHCCLYFVNAAGHGLKPLDIAIMKDLHDKVNIVPVIAKADTLTKKEVKQLKERILREIQSNEIQIYQFPEADDEEDDEEFIRVNKELKASVPFAVVGSNTVYDISGKKVRGRIYPWGVVDIENPSHCDFTMLRNMLIRTHMQDLKDVTQDIHYENFRAKKLQSGTTEPTHPPADRRPEQVDGRDALLREKEAELKRMQEMIEKMQASMLQQQKTTEQQQQQQQLLLKQQQQTTNTPNGALPQVTT